MKESYQTGEILHNRFEILNLFKSTELSQIYLALDKVNASKVIIKFATSDGNDGKGKIRLDGLRTESAILQMLNHPSIVRFVDSWGNNSSYNLATEYVDAKSMKELDTDNSLTREQIIEYITQVLETTEYLHKKKLVHRDIKPSNLLMSDTVVILDFGAAEFQKPYSSQSNSIIGTPGYQCPESFRGIISTQSDIYSIGATLLFLLTKQAPSGDLSRFKTMTEHLDLLRIAFQAMDPNPQNRFKTASELKLRLLMASSLGTRLIHKAEIYKVLKSAVSIGRAEDSDFNVQDQLKYVSPFHANLCKSEKEYFLVDRSINGTFLYKDENYTKIDRSVLNDGDIIALCYKPSKGPYKILKFRKGND
jgi:serine/threonine protein kinase